jgi:hypothetical protein
MKTCTLLTFAILAAPALLLAVVLFPRWEHA